MGALEIYIKIFMQKLWNILWPLFENKKETKKLNLKKESDQIEKVFTDQGVTKVPDGYSLKLQGKNMCDGEPMESGGPLSILDEFDDQKSSTYVGDDQFMLMLDRGRRRCNKAEDCKFISIWKDGSYSMYNSQNCTGSKDGLNTSVTLENLHQFSGGRVVVDEESGQTEIQLPPPAPSPPPPPPPLPTIDSREKCSDYIKNDLKSYDSGKTYPGLSLSNTTNYCTSMVNRPGIVRGCQQRICAFSTGTRAGTVLDGLSPGWQEYDNGNGVKYYMNSSTGESTWQKPRNIADGNDFFEMKHFCPDVCLNLIGNEVPVSQSRSGSILDAIGEVYQVPDTLSGNPWMPVNTIFNQLPDITEDDCLSVNVNGNWKPSKGSWFNVYGSPEEACAENPDLPGYGVLREKNFIGLTDNKKACHVEYRSSGSSCNRDCKLRFIKTEARAAGQHNRYKARITSWDELREKSGGNLSDFGVDFADLIETDLRKEWEIGRKKGVKWGIDERPGVGHINQGVSNHYLYYTDLDAPYGYKIWAEYVDVEAPKLGSGKCSITQPGWFRTAKIPITKDESDDMYSLKNEYNFGSRVKVKLVNEDKADEVLVIDDPESGHFTEVYSKTNKNHYGRFPTGKRNWVWDGPISLG